MENKELEEYKRKVAEEEKYRKQLDEDKREWKKQEDDLHVTLVWFAIVFIAFYILLEVIKH